jgi:hypothetical protein
VLPEYRHSGGLVGKWMLGRAEHDMEALRGGCRAFLQSWRASEAPSLFEFSLISFSYYVCIFVNLVFFLF